MLLFIPLLLCQSMAFAGSTSALKALVDDYRYSLTVEWDQKNEAQLKAIQSKFHQGVKELQAQGLSMADVKAVAAGTQDAELVAVLGHENAAGELQSLIDSRSKEMYAQGAQWSPGAIFGWGLAILFVFEIVVLAMKDSECPNSVEYPEGVRYDCEWPN